MAHAYQTGTGGGEQDFAGKEVYLGRTVVEGSPWKECDYGEETFFATKADGGIYSSTHEMLQWMQALERGEVISKEALALAYAPHTKVSGSPWSDYQNRPNTWYGYGFFIDRTPGEPVKIYHTGDNGGFQNYAASFPSCGVKVIVFANRNDFDRWTPICRSISAVVAWRRPLRSLRKRFSLSGGICRALSKRSGRVMWVTTTRCTCDRGQLPMLYPMLRLSLPGPLLLQ